MTISKTKEYPSIKQVDDGYLIRVEVKPCSQRSEIIITSELGIQARVRSPPTRGKANRELLNLFTKKLGVKNDSLEIIRGSRSNVKWIKIKCVKSPLILTKLKI